MTTEQMGHFNFDAFMAENEKVGPTITIYGKVEQLPPSLPAIITVKTMRMMKARGKSAETQVAELVDMAYAIFTQERLDGWFTKGLSMDGLEALLKHSIELYTQKATANQTPSGGRKSK